MQVDYRPRIARLGHRRVVVADPVQQGATGDFQVFDVMAVPDDVHLVDVEERHDDLCIGVKHSLATHAASSVVRRFVADTGAIRLRARGLR
ncbi:hypothetical protein D3C75_1226730 [compost metagenome]